MRNSTPLGLQGFRTFGHSNAAYQQDHKPGFGESETKASQMAGNSFFQDLSELAKAQDAQAALGSNSRVKVENHLVAHRKTHGKERHQDNN